MGRSKKSNRTSKKKEIKHLKKKIRVLIYELRSCGKDCIGRLDTMYLRDTPAREKMRIPRKRKLKITEEKKIRLWKLLRIIKGLNPSLWRIDRMNNLIFYGDYGLQTTFGWNVDHKRPFSKGGSDELWNLQCLHSKSNSQKGNIYPFKYPSPQDHPVNISKSKLRKLINKNI